MGSGGAGFSDAAAVEATDGGAMESLVLDSSSLPTLEGGPAGSLGRCHGAPVVGCVCRPNGIKK